MTVLKQYDSRWGRKNYNGSSSIATAACGPFSISNILIERNPDFDPMTAVKFMQRNGYAVYNHGTSWSGIPAAMKSFGCTDVRAVNVSKNMDKVWDILSNGNYAADFLFSAGKRGGVCWTTSGHYVAVTGYKVKDGKHWLYTKDSGGRDHDGWYCYEKHMRGLIPKVWTCKLPVLTKTYFENGSYKTPKATKPTKLPTLPARGYFKKGDYGNNVAEVQNILIYLGIDCGPSGADKDYGKKTVAAVKIYEKRYGLKPDGKWGSKCNNKARDILKIK